MNNFRKGDILRGSVRDFHSAFHYVVFPGGSEQAPIAVVLTTSDRFPCNMQLDKKYFKICDFFGKPHEITYFVAHRIEKLSEWGPYTKVGELTNRGIAFIEANLPNSASMKWNEYEKRKGPNGCPEHPS